MNHVGVFTDVPGIELEQDARMGHVQQVWPPEYDFQQPYEREHVHHNQLLGMKVPSYHVSHLPMKVTEHDIYVGESPYQRNGLEAFSPGYSTYHVVSPRTPSVCSPATLSYDDNDTESTTSKSQMWSVAPGDELTSRDSAHIHQHYAEELMPEWNMGPQISHSTPSPILPTTDAFCSLDQVYPESELSTPILLGHCEGGVTTPAFHSAVDPYAWTEPELPQTPPSESWEDEESSQESVEEAATDEDDPPYNPSHPSKPTHKRRVSSNSKKQLRVRRQNAHRRSASGGAGQKAGQMTGAGRAFPCPLANYGCSATFASKNEWKRHVATQHVKLGFWRCDLCPPTSSGHNDFNRKDLFTQHLKRMHRQHIVDKYDPEKLTTYKDVTQIEDKDLKDATEPLVKLCLRELRHAPTRCRCLFCDKVFKGTGAWESRMEHIANHLERSRKSGSKVLPVHEWREDEDLEKWLEDEGLIEQNKGKWQIGVGRPIRNERKLKSR